MNENGVVWMDGKLVPWKEATIHVLTHSFHYGSAAFEGIRCYKGERGAAIFRLKDHVERLFDSARIYRMTVPFTSDQVLTACVETVRANKLDECYLRPLIYRGYGKMGVNPIGCPVNVMIAVWPWGAYLGEGALDRGIRAKVSSWQRVHPNTVATKAKMTGNYVNSILATMEAKEDGYEEAILLDPSGCVAEGAGENLFCVKDEIIRTPLSTDILMGITRETVMTIARDLGYEVREETMSRDMLYIADEVFMCGTAAEVTPVREVDRRTVGAGTRGPITTRIQAEYFKAVKGQSPRYAGWLTPVAPAVTPAPVAAR